MLRKSLLLAAMLAALTTGAEAKRPWVFFGFPNSTSVTPAAISGHNQIVGTWMSGSSTYHGFQRTPHGTASSIDVPGATQTLVADVNLDGVMAGYFLVDTSAHGFIRDAAGQFHSFDVPQMAATGVSAINNKGAATGVGIAFALQIGFVREPDGTLTTFAPPAAQYTTTVAINERGWIAGHFTEINGDFHAFVRDRHGSIAVFDAPGAYETLAEAMNDKCEIVGDYTVRGSADTRSYVREPDGTITTFVPSGAGIAPVKSTQTTGIDELGEIAGTFMDTSGHYHGFVRKTDGSFLQIDAPGHADTHVTRIASDGKIIGYADGEGFRLNRRAWKGE